MQDLVFLFWGQDAPTAHFLLATHAWTFLHAIVVQFIAIVILVVIHHHVLVLHLLHVLHAWPRV